MTEIGVVVFEEELHEDLLADLTAASLPPSLSHPPGILTLTPMPPEPGARRPLGLLLLDSGGLPMTPFVFPPDGGPLDPRWSAPLDAVARAIVLEPRYRFFDVADFMVMGLVVRRKPRPDIFLYKHGYTRRYLNLDEGGHAYRYAPPRDVQRGSGRYMRHRSLRDAVDHLLLWDLPWMKPSLAGHRHGLVWEDRWRLDTDGDGDGGDTIEKPRGRGHGARFDEDVRPGSGAFM
jgi:hypothetical protein